MTISSFGNNAREFGCELTKAVGRQALAMAPAIVGSKLCQLAGYGAPFSSVISGIYGFASIGSGLHSAAKLTGRVTSLDTSFMGKVKDVLNVGAGVAIVAHAAAPTPLTAMAVGATVGLSGMLNVYSGINQIEEGMKVPAHRDWKKVAEGVVSAGLGMLSFQHAASQAMALMEDQVPTTTTKNEIELKNNKPMPEGDTVKPSIEIDTAKKLAEAEAVETIQKKECPNDNIAITSIQGSQCDVGLSKVVFLSDLHTDKQQNIDRQHYLNSVIKEADVLLLEGVTSTDYHDASVHEQSNLIKHNIYLSGWDSLELHNAATTKLKRAFALEQMIETETNPDIKIKLMNEYDELFNTKQIWAIEDRNEYMVKRISSILKLLQEKQRIFVIAGKRHLNEKLLKQFDGKYTAVFFNEVSDYKANEQYAMEYGYKPKPSKPTWSLKAIFGF